MKSGCGLALVALFIVARCVSCVPDTSKCGGQVPPISCSFGKYLDPEKAGNDLGTDVANCCTDVATCGSNGYTCPAGYKGRLNSNTTQCKSDVASCGTSESECCEPDPTTCGGNQQLTVDRFLAPPFGCGRSMYRDPAKAGERINSFLSVSNTCCSIKASCKSGAYSCPVGFRKASVSEDLLCTSNAESCATTCCEMVPAKCGEQTHVSCGLGKFHDPAKAGNDVGSSIIENCCSYNASLKDDLGRLDVPGPQFQSQSLVPISNTEQTSEPTSLDIIPWFLFGVTMGLLCAAAGYIVKLRRRLHVLKVERFAREADHGQVVGVPVPKSAQTDGAVHGTPPQDKTSTEPSCAI